MEKKVNIKIISYVLFLFIYLFLGSCGEINKSTYDYNVIKKINNVDFLVLQVPKGQEINSYDYKIRELMPNSKAVKPGLELSMNNNNNIKPLYNITNDIKTMNFRYVKHLSNYKGIVFIDSLTNVQKDIVYNLLKTKQTGIVYMIYKNISDKSSETDIGSALKLTEFLNLLRVYFYRLGRTNMYLQEVKYKKIPVDEVILIFKPISNNIFKNLPKQENVYNADKGSSNDWMNAVLEYEKSKLLQQKIK